MNISLPSHYTSLAQALVSVFGTSVAIAHTDRLSGGDINKAYGLTLTSGDHVFMKANSKENASFFTAEAASLSAIASTQTIKTPQILCTGTDDGEDVGYSFLLLKYIESTEPKKDYWETFGRELAYFHKADTKKIMDDFQSLDNGQIQGPHRYGFFQDNFIGSRPQINTPSESWISFFRDCRLVPQFKDADSYFTEKDRSQITKLLDHLEDFLTEGDFPSLLHGDLWKGNAMCSSNETPVLIDPASYIGYFEADIAMTELFGGFPSKFYESYREVNPIDSGYEDRRDLYNLYHLLNHLNIFGQSYLNPVLSIVAEYVG